MSVKSDREAAIARGKAGRAKAKNKPTVTPPPKGIERIAGAPGDTVLDRVLKFFTPPPPPKRQPDQ